MHTKVIDFWFSKLTPKHWWKKDTTLDQDIRDRFQLIHNQASACELFSWRHSPHGRLAEVIVLDQFSRNIYRDKAQAFTTDSLALALAQEAVHLGADKALNPAERSFLYMPYMHSESLIIHEQAVELFEKNGEKNNLDFELKHKAIIERFGRYPHRNKILGRQSTAEEIEFLQQPGSSF
ncbi:DUF924 family protein [Teredinibacter sp. KSP-S5-2]|uniref:DUF924 family protein n=1 Tax=Teredinibacter sp. KSP-S5-2 TaxID=3034506 RepID=UPI0029347730|nr:DUF924 family protein [Teredinibacter sp. KSP-S5-2]WNO08798.1 DUF924 domain-containing protein [Teredinibacter sp. KSP-S5-2]